MKRKGKELNTRGEQRRGEEKGQEEKMERENKGETMKREYKKGRGGNVHKTERGD